MSSPKVWGRYFWTTFHIAALGYPDKPSHQDAMLYKQFFSQFGKILPCQKCAVNYDRHLAELPLDKALVNREALFAWTVAFHNLVNREQHKSEWTLDYAKEFFMSGSYNECQADDAYNLRTDMWRMILVLVMTINIVVLIYCFYWLLHHQ